MSNLKNILDNINWKGVSREHPLGKIEAECLDIRPLLDTLNIDYARVEKSERPDFILDRSIGIELVSCYPQNYDKGVKSIQTDAYLDRVCVEYKKYLDTLGLYFWVTIHYNDNAVFNDKIHDSIPKFTREVINELEEVRLNGAKDNFKYIRGATFHPFNINEVTQVRAMWVPDISIESLVDTIKHKEALLTSYKKENPHINKWWLFIKCTDHVETSNIKKEIFSSSYDKVFLFVSKDFKLIDLK